MRADMGKEAAALDDAPRAAAALSLRLWLRLMLLPKRGHASSPLVLLLLRRDDAAPPPSSVLASSPPSAHTGRQPFFSVPVTGCHARGCRRRLASSAKMPATRASTRRATPCTSCDTQV